MDLRHNTKSSDCWRKCGFSECKSLSCMLVLPIIDSFLARSFAKIIPETVTSNMRLYFGFMLSWQEGYSERKWLKPQTPTGDD